MAKEFSSANVMASINGHKNQVINRVLDTVNDEMANAAMQMQTTIQTVPSSLRKGKIGRVDTGLMLSSVDIHDMAPAGRGVWRGSFGWTDVKEQYFRSQEYGTGDRSGDGTIRNISPMHALTGASIMFVQQVKARF